ncbi:MAG: hypothetical protein V7K48_12105 [Nostoc sp.]|uniref:hypothetical protein n=1 Tax=Nostoc sp. TaxID=1180 RepID=UPI002FF716F9
MNDYYSAIARQDYKQAYSAWEGNGAASKQSFEQFKQGFANTTSVAVEVGKPGRPDPGAGSIYIEIPVTVTAIGTNGRNSTAISQQQWELASLDLLEKITFSQPVNALKAGSGKFFINNFVLQK